MLEFLVQRAAISIVTLFVISMIVFTGVRMIPGDPARVMAGSEADAAGLEEVRQKYGLGDPIAFQYLRWVGLALRGDLGESIRTRESVVKDGGDEAPDHHRARRSCRCSLAVGHRHPRRGPGGCAAQHHLGHPDQRRLARRRVHSDFWLGIMLILFFSVRLGWLPASGFVPPWESPLGNLQRMLMPAIVLGTALAAVLMRQTRNSMIEVMSADYIRTAYSKGLAGRVVVFRHAIRNSLIPVVTILGLEMGALMSGAVVTEQIFVVPGFGRLIVESVFTRDYPLVQGVVLITASADVLINLLVDVSYSLLDPRIRVRGAAGDA